MNVILKKLSPEDGATGSGGNPLGHLDAGGSFASDVFAEFGIGAAPDGLSEFGNAVDARSEVHALSLTTFRGHASPHDGVIQHICEDPHNVVMDKWIQHPNFLEDIREHRSRTGMTQDLLAQDWGVSIFTVRKWVTGEKAPGDARKRQLAIYFGKPISRYLDQPDPFESALTEVARFQLDQVKGILCDPRFNDMDRQELVNEMKAKASWMLAIKSKQETK